MAPPHGRQKLRNNEKHDSEWSPRNVRICPTRKRNSNVIIHFMRHAEPLHKVDSNNPDLTMLDPDLSPRGREQCLSFARDFEPQSKYITHIISCPMTRTLTTSLLALSSVISRGVPVLALPELQNLDPGPAGRGKDPAELEQIYCANGGKEDSEFRGKINLTFMTSGWNGKDEGKWQNEVVQWRVDYIKGFLRGLGAGSPDIRVEVMVISHGSFLKKLIEDGLFDDGKMESHAEWVNVGLIVGGPDEARFADVPVRSFGFDESGNLRELDRKELDIARGLLELSREQNASVWKGRLRPRTP